MTRDQILDLFVDLIKGRGGWMVNKLDSITPQFNRELCRKDLVDFLAEVDACDDVAVPRLPPL